MEVYSSATCLPGKMRLRKLTNSAGTGTSTMKYERVKEKMIDTSASSVISASASIPCPSRCSSGITSGHCSSLLNSRPTR
ncbi:hypothetical protein D3C79_941140 [compost metagenome]